MFKVALGRDHLTGSAGFPGWRVGRESRGDARAAKPSGYGFKCGATLEGGDARQNFARALDEPINHVSPYP